jgi:hypothetical protein
MRQIATESEVGPVARLRVPQAYREAFSQLTKLSDAELRDLNKAVLDGSGSQTAIRDAIASTVTGGTLAYESLIAIAAARVSQQISAREAADQLRDSLGADAGPGDLAALLENPRIVRLAKQVDLLVAFERRLHTFRIFTDLRPIFNENATEIEYILITNTLQLIYRQDGELRESYLRVDDDDLVRILHQAERALKKTERAQRFASEAGAEVLTDHPEEFE